MVDHFTLLDQYKAPFNAELTFPKDSEMLDIAGDKWEWQPGYNKTQPTPRDKTLWAQSDEDIAKYKAAYIEKHGDFSRPFTESTMMIAPVEWRTGYDSEVEANLAILATKRGEANEIKTAMGIVNNSIQQIESLLYSVQSNLTIKRRLRSNKAYAELATREAPEELATLDSDLVALAALEESYQEQLKSLRTDGQTLNQELTRELKNYKETATLLNIDDGFAARLEKEVRSTRTNYFTGGTLFGGVAGVAIAGFAIYLLASSSRGASRRTRTTGRGADGLFFRS